MALEKRSLTQVDNGVWAASTTISTDLQRVGVITEIEMTNEITPSATLTGATISPDSGFRPVQNMRIVGALKTYFNLPADPGGQGGTLWHYMNKADGFGLGHLDGAVAAPARAYTPVTHTFHCGARPRDQWGRRNQFDLSAFIPAQMDGQLRAEWVTTPNTVLDDVVTLNSAVMRFTLHYVVGTHAEIQEEMARQGVMLPASKGEGVITGMVPEWQSTVRVPTATAADYTHEFDGPIGGFLARIGFLAQDATATRPLRAGDELTGIRLKLAGQELITIFGDQLNNQLEYGSFVEADDAAADFQAFVPRGIYLLNLRDRGHQPWNHDYGFDLRNYGAQSFKIGLTLTTNAAGDDILVAYERYVPITIPVAPLG